MHRNATTRLSIFQLLLYAFLAITFVTNGILTTIFYVFMMKNIESDTKGDIYERSASINNYFNGMKEDLTRSLRMIADNPLLTPASIDSEAGARYTDRAVEALFTQYINHFKEFRSIALVDSQGRIQMKINRKGRMQGVQSAGKSPLFEKIASDSTYGISFDTPQKDADGRVFFQTGIGLVDRHDNRCRGAILIDCDMTELMNNISSLEYLTETPIWITTADGEFLRASSLATPDSVLHTRPAPEFNELATTVTGEQGLLILQDHSLVRGRPFIKTAMSIPNTLLYESAKQTRGFFLVVFLFSTAAVTAAAYILARRLSVPLNMLTHSAARLAQGDLSIRAKGAKSREGQVLIDTFNRMAEELEQKTRELLAAQNELVRNEKLTMLGLIAGGMGNELRNPLGVMNNAVFYLKSILPDADETVKEYLEIISQEIDNSHQIIADLLEFSLFQLPRAEPFSLPDLVKQCLEKCSIPEGVTVALDLPGNLPLVVADPPQIDRVVQHLLTNAVQAMEDGGQLTISATADKEEAGISVSDTGVGIAEENLGKVFEPLFSTKSRGLGLGLALSKKYVEANKGKIEVESALGQGTTFRFTLPVEGGVDMEEKLEGRTGLRVGRNLTEADGGRVKVAKKSGTGTAIIVQLPGNGGCACN